MKIVSTVSHKGKQITYFDFCKVNTENYYRVLKDAKIYIKKQPNNSLLTLTDMRVPKYMPTEMKIFNEFVRDNKPYVKAAAIVGIEGIKKILLKIAETFSDRRIHTFDTIEEAEDWLIKQ